MPPSPTDAASREAPRSAHTLPRIAIVGRPNVGKSSLVNMLAARRVSIVDDTPGTTRDRVSAIVALEGERPEDPAIRVELVDTGGFGVYTVEGRRVSNDGQDLAPLGADVERQIAFAVDSADLVLFVIDTQAGVTPQDREVARLLREGGLGGPRARDRAARGAGTQPVSEHGRVVVLANKCDGPRWEAHAFEAATLGFGEAIIVSAKNNYNRRHLIERLHEIVRRTVRGAAGGGAAPGEVAPDMQLAIVGKRNAGKSTLVNTLAGEQRVIVSEIAGTTRDAVDVRFEMDGRSFVAIDTAGLRKRKSFQDRIEWWALDRCHLAIERADVCLLMVDATIPISAVDKQLGMMIAEAFKPVVIVVNKWDLAEGRPLADGRAKRGRPRPVTTGHYEEYLRAELKGLWYAPIAFMSARNDRNVRETIDLAFELFNQSQTRATTGKLNRVVRGILEHQRPPSGSGAFAKLLYVAQVAVSPPTIVCVVNHPELFTPTYQRFLLNRFREELPFTEVPIKLLIRGRRRDEVIETAEGEIARVRDEDAEADVPAAAPALSASEAEDVDWSVEHPGEDAAKYFDEPAPGPGKARQDRAERPAADRPSTPRRRPKKPTTAKATGAERPRAAKRAGAPRAGKGRRSARR
ncbi:MAG: GTPase [Phycisphaerales bacterium]